MDFDFYNYAYHCLREAIFSTDEEGAEWYNSSECTIENFFCYEVSGGILYNHPEERKSENIIGEVSALAETFEAARVDAYQKYLDNQ